MASTFSFGFSGDDIDIDESEINDEQEQTTSAEGAGNPLPELIEAKTHEIGEWLPTLPSQLSYNRLTITKPQNDSGREITLARREIFDVRTQLMAEDSTEQDSNEELIAGLEEGDLKPNVYEGGFKTWECALDLGRLVANEDLMGFAEADVNLERHVIELGAGTAIPSLTLFAQLLLKNESGLSKMRTHFTFADYNSTVLRLVTLPNLLLTWNEIVSRQSTPADAPSAAEDGDEELDITPELLDSFVKDLSTRGITVAFISGAWSPEFVNLVLGENSEGNRRTLVMASETIYSPSSLGIFSETLLELLRRSTTPTVKSRALIAAKKVYFGVGGGVDEFLTVLKGISGNQFDVKEKLDIKSEGVGRVVLDISESGSGCQ
ncbi:hypothetical protein PHISCL_02253 [Aspergillus sclerotialis]|uniref:protein-histidine N-methyltransferase n=1 Tax=Aspergillus sclerotialis TaxID=2070753 RepID=A0A3A2ZRU7_9EURO|nr:hypothetical protein PHISCL_02253 [Aspergillus sclerotialis]